jgi:AcrR family transcriptional regulator
MRDVAKAAGMSLGAAYYYFPSKEALVHAHWEQQMAEHERRAREKYAQTSDLRERLRATFLIRQELMKNDKKLLAGLFRAIGDPSSPVSVFAKETSSLRMRGIALLQDCVAVDEVPVQVRDQAALGLWVLQLGFVLYFVHDDSPGQRKTRQLIEGAVDTLAPLAPLLGMPAADPLRARVQRVLEEAGLWLPR